MLFSGYTTKVWRYLQRRLLLLSVTMTTELYESTLSLPVYANYLQN